ncbi:MAG: NUDIX domain-containing protein [Mycobacterium sp.]
MRDNEIPDPDDSTVAQATDNFCYQFPRAIVAVDTALLTIDPDRGLLVVEMERGDSGKWALPGTFLRERETLAGAVERSLEEKLGVQDIKPMQLGVFDDPDRDERDWVLSVAHVAVVRPEQLESLGTGIAKDTRIVSVDRPGELAWDHPNIVKRAKEYVRSRYEEQPDPDRLLGNTFTLRELRLVHDAVADNDEPPWKRDAFRRRMQNLLVPTGVKSENTGLRGRPAQLFRRRSARDRSL